MIGLIYTPDKRLRCAEMLRRLFMRSGIKSCDPIIAFSISDVDLEQKVVSGAIISENNIKYARVQLPSVIFNLSLVQKKNDIKALRGLSCMKDLVLVNTVNRFDQWMIMEMAHSSPKVKEYFLPYHIYAKALKNFKPDDDQDYIAIPARGSSISRVIYVKFNKITGKSEGNQFFRKGHVCDYIDASMCQKRWIFIEVPELLTCDDSPCTARLYLQKKSYDSWMVIGKDVNSLGWHVPDGIIKSFEDASLKVINHINRFLPGIGHCFIDFILGDDGAPYFLHLGGFDHHFLYESRDEEMYGKFFRNILNLADEINAV